MIEETAHVVAVEGDHAWVESERRSSCGGCAAKGCGTGALSKVLGAKKQQIKVRNPVAAGVGDSVVLGIEEKVLLQGSLMVYILPLVLMLAGGLLGEVLAPQWGVGSEGAALLFGVPGLLGGFLWLRGYNRRCAADPQFSAVILRITPPAGMVKPVSMNL
ncbi:MAG: SoxR reducing system RseC family protein [Gammaproteobacteria bacterium]|nr:SoxR reducing system RseC family protein [Gammaproteobacteria bacterium]